MSRASWRRPAPTPSSPAPPCSRAALSNPTKPIFPRSAKRRRSRGARRFKDATAWGGIMGLEIFALRERPDLRPLIFASDLQSVWPEFMTHSAAAELYFGPSMFDRYLDYAFAGVADGKVVARAFSVPFAFTDGRAELPDGGWDQVIRWAHD